MNILLITNDWLPKKGGISTYLTKLSENLNSNLIIYAPNWADGENVIKSKDKFIFNPNKAFQEIQEIVVDKEIDIILLQIHQSLCSGIRIVALEFHYCNISRSMSRCNWWSTRVR